MVSFSSRVVRALQVAGVLAILVCPAFAQLSGEPEFSQAYKALAAKDYDQAIDLFRAGLAKDPSNGAVHKDLAYTLLKTGDNAEARDQFEAAMRLNPADETAALEFAFLAYETGKPIEARRTFDRLRAHASAAGRATAEQAFQNIDKPLAQGIARWQEALSKAADANALSTYSAHWELAQLAELRDELPLAAEQYEICRRLKSEKADLLPILARVWMQLGRREEAHAAWLAASRSPDPRTAETALEQIGQRYPYAYEFVNAIRIDPRNSTLRNELGFLYLAMGKQQEAITVFQEAVSVDSRNRVAQEQLDALLHHKHVTPTVTSASPSLDAKAMGLKSFALGYSRDAIKYLEQAHEQDPDDAEVMLKLGYAYNYAHDDPDALQWFERARYASDPAIAKEATQAYRNLSGELPLQTTFWSFPLYSSRWHDVFDYGQLKRSLPLPRIVNRWLSLYLSSRFSGDVKSSIPQHAVDPMYLSDSAVILGAGLSTRVWHHAMGWFEAGESIQYLPFRHDVGGALPDYRGGFNYARVFGTTLGSSKSGWFTETNSDAVYVFRYDRDWIFSNQVRAGETVHGRAQIAWNLNYLHDLKNQYWAETVETGPGVRVHIPGMRPGIYLLADFLRGVYTNNVGNPRRPNYDDIRIGFWYAATK